MPDDLIPIPKKSGIAPIIYKDDGSVKSEPSERQRDQLRDRQRARGVFQEQKGSEGNPLTGVFSATERLCVGTEDPPCGCDCCGRSQTAGKVLHRAGLLSEDDVANTDCCALLQMGRLVLKAGEL